MSAYLNQNQARTRFFMTDKPNGQGYSATDAGADCQNEQLWWNTQDGKDGGGTAYGNDMTCLPTCPVP